MSGAAVPAGTPIYTKDGNFLGQLTIEPWEYHRHRMMTESPNVYVTDAHRHQSREVILDLGFIRFGETSVGAWFLVYGAKEDVALCSCVAPAWRKDAAT